MASDLSKEDEVAAGVPAEAQDREAQWAMVLNATERAIQWVKDNRQYLTYFDISISPSKEFGVSVGLGFVESERAKALSALFAGRKAVKRTHDKNHSSYSLKADDLQLKFRWDVWHFCHEPEPEVVDEEVTF